LPSPASEADRTAVMLEPVRRPSGWGSSRAYVHQGDLERSNRKRAMSPFTIPMWASVRLLKQRRAFTTEIMSIMTVLVKSI
jgi:hypothetical protein